MTNFQRNRRVVALESRCEILKHLRTPSFIIPTLTFPILFYLFFGVAMGSRGVGGGASLGVYLIATYGAFGVIGAALSSFGVSLALERGQGLLQLKQATPMPLFAYILAKLASAIVFSSMVTLSLFAVGTALGGARLDAQQLAMLFATLVAGTVPFALLGLTVGYIVSADAAIAVVNLLYLPMGFLSGLWIPIDFLPNTVKQIATFLPAFHFGQLALSVIDIPAQGTPGGHMTALVGFTLLFLATATAAYRVDRRRNDA
jgi:ABC-2 type transport system permease protein